MINDSDNNDTDDDDDVNDCDNNEYDDDLLQISMSMLPLVMAIVFCTTYIHMMLE